MDKTKGSFVMFTHWSPYKAPSDSLVDEDELVVWQEVLPGDVGIVVKDERDKDNDQVVVLFSRMNTLLKIHVSMLTAVKSD